jgi:hypothetical protein
LEKLRELFDTEKGTWMRSAYDLRDTREIHEIHEKGADAMSNIVTCDVCGKIFNQSHLSAHKRLAHGKRPQAASEVSEPEAVESILSAYEKLSDKTKEEVRERLDAPSKREE